MSNVTSINKLPASDTTSQYFGDTLSIIVNMDSYVVQRVSHTARIIGFIQIRNLVPIINSLNLESNPRNSKQGAVTDAIQETLLTSPELLPFKSKGVLLAASSYEKLERNRLSLDFEDKALEGILDGGHNTLAVGLHLLTQAITDCLEKDPSFKKDPITAAKRMTKRAKTWSEFKDLWNQYREELEAIRTNAENNRQLLSLEIIVPTDPNSEESATFFREHLLEICAARNNNVQLKQISTANQEGLLDFIRDALLADARTAGIVDRIVWKTNESGDIDARDLVALSWVALSQLDLPKTEDGEQIDSISAVNTYSGKATALNRYMDLARSPEVSVVVDNGYKRQLVSKSVESALALLPDLVEAWDVILKEFPDAYNKGAAGKFGLIKAVQSVNRSKNDKKSLYFQWAINQNMPVGYIAPLVWGLQALIKKNPDNTLSWYVNPVEFLHEHMNQMAVIAKPILELCAFDPQKFGKSAASYDNIKREFRMLYMEQVMRDM